MSQLRKQETRVQKAAGLARVRQFPHEHILSRARSGRRRAQLLPERRVLALQLEHTVREDRVEHSGAREGEVRGEHAGVGPGGNNVYGAFSKIKTYRERHVSLMLVHEDLKLHDRLSATDEPLSPVLHAQVLDEAARHLQARHPFAAHILEVRVKRRGLRNALAVRVRADFRGLLHCLERERDGQRILVCFSLKPAPAPFVDVSVWDAETGRVRELSRAIVEELGVAINNFKARFRVRFETYFYDREFAPTPRFSLRMRVATQMLLEYAPAVRCLFGDASGARLWRSRAEPLALPLRADTVPWAEARARMLADCVDRGGVLVAS